MAAPSDPTPRLPHAAPFLLLDRVVDVGEKSGVFSKHVTGADPCVAADGTLPAAFLLEALAQGGGALVAAMQDDAPKVGYLASVRNVALHVTRLDDLETDLIAAAERITGDGHTVLYEFSVWGALRLLLSGRASIVFDATFGVSSGSRT